MNEETIGEKMAALWGRENLRDFGDPAQIGKG